MEIKTTLKQLTALFAQSASTEELPVPIRRFAAQLTLLTAHVQRVEAKIDALSASTDANVAELAQHVIALKPKTAEQPVGEVPAATDAERGAGAANLEGLDEDEAAQEMAERALRETEEEARTLAAASNKPASVVPLRPNGQQPTTEEAS